MPKTQTKNPHPIVKILSDLNLTPKVGEEVDEKTYLRALMSAINIIESSSKDKTGDARSRMLREELKRVRKLHKSKDTGKEYRDHMGLKDDEKHKKGEYRERRTTISGDKLMGREPKKDAPPTTGKPKLLTGIGNFNTDDVKPADVDKAKSKKKKDSSGLNPDKLESIAKTVESIALLLRRQFKLEKKQQRDSRRQQSKDDRDAREDKLETKPDGKTGLLPNAIKKPTLNFFEKLKTFFLNIAIGAGAMKLMQWLKNPENAEKITKFKDFLVNNAGWILGGLATIALLPIAVSLVTVVKGILAGLALLGPLLPLLPWILGGLLLGAVAWWIGKKLFGEREYTGRERTWIERKENKERLRAAGIVTATDKRLEILDEKTGKKMRVPMYGENSITGRKAVQGEQPNAMPTLNLLDAKHQEWYVKNYGQEALDAKLAAHKSFRDTKAALISTAKDMEKEINEVKAKYKKLMDANDSLSFKERYKANNKLEKEMKAEIKAIKEKTGQKAIEIGDNVTGDKQIEIDTTDNSAVIDKDVKINTEVSPPNTKTNGGINIVNGGTGTTGVTDGGSSGGDGEGADEDDVFSSEDPNDPSVFSSKSLYNMGG